MISYNSIQRLEACLNRNPKPQQRPPELCHLLPLLLDLFVLPGQLLKLSSPAQLARLAGKPEREQMEIRSKAKQG